MPHAPFIWASYAIALVVFVWLAFTSWRTARQLEAKLDALKQSAPLRRGRVSP
ncbi:MAG: heme exporter protein CcmD [Pseudomonadota bacterium]